MNPLASSPKNGSSPSPIGWMPKATHGLMLFLGIAVWYALSGPKTPDNSQPSETTRSLARPNPDTRASAWIDATVKKFRQTELEQEAKNKKPATMEDFLRKTREESANSWQQEQEEIDHILTQARAMGPIKDPSAALFTAQRSNGYTDELVIFQRWLDTDPDAALSEMESNWGLLKQTHLSSLLRLKFGIDWVNSKMADPESPIRLRRALAEELARQSARGDGLAKFLEFYQGSPDPELKIYMARQFADEWPLDQPKAVAQFLSGGVPKELHNMLMRHWSRMTAYHDTSWEEAWMTELHERLGMEPFEVADHRGGMCGLGGLFSPVDMAQWEARKAMSYEEIVQDCIKAGNPPQEAARRAIQSKMNQALDENPTLIESFGEGKFTRSALLEELHRKIPGANSDSDLFEQQLWQMTAWTAAPQEVARWAAELSQRGNIDELLISTFTTESFSEEPRMPLRLQRYRIVTKDMPDQGPSQPILSHAAWEWSRWYAASPVTAEAWKNSLPENEPLLLQIREKQASEQHQQEDP